MKYINNYNVFINENLQQAKSIISKKMEDFEKLKELVGKNIGYIGKLTDFLFNESIPYIELENLYEELIDLRNKSYQIDINKLTYEKTLDKIQETKNNMYINLFLKELPSEQKQIIKNIFDEKDDDYYYSSSSIKDIKNIIIKISQKPNLKVFISKVSRYKDSKSLIGAMKMFAKDSMNDISLIKEKLKELKDSKVVFENEKIMIVYVKEYEHIKILGSDTSWCIVNSQHTWSSYTSGNYQFILYNKTFDEYDRKFKIGFTLKPDSTIKAAHDILDGSASSDLRMIINENDINLIDIIPTSIDVKEFDLSTINRRTPVRTIRELALRIENDKIPQLIKKIIDNNIGGMSTKLDIFDSLIKKYFNQHEYYTYNDIIKLEDGLKNYYTSDTTRIRTDNYIRLSLTDYQTVNNLKIGFSKVFSDEFIVKNIPDDFYRKNNSNTDYIIKIISDRLNSIYKTDIYKNFNKIDGVKFPLRFEINMLLFNNQLNRKTENYDKIINMVKNNRHVMFYYRKFLNVPFELDKEKDNYYSGDLEELIPLIIKKDYPNSNVYINANLITYDKLIKHLDGYKIGFNIFKSSLNRILNSSYKYNNDSSIYNILRSIPKNPRANTTHTIGDVTITIKA